MTGTAVGQSASVARREPTTDEISEHALLAPRAAP